MYMWVLIIHYLSLPWVGDRMPYLVFVVAGGSCSWYQAQNLLSPSLTVCRLVLVTII